MSKEYVCNSCKAIITSPHEVKMKEFYIGCSFELGGVYPSLDKRKGKIHLCDKCFLGLRKIGEKTVQEWISVSDPPKKDGKYLVHKDLWGTSVISTHCFAKKGESVCAFDLKGKKNIFYDYDSETGYFSVDSVTHWMPLPEAPKGE